MISTIVPRPIAWVVTQDPDSGINLAPFSFFNIFSDDPPLVCLGFGSSERGDAGEKDTAANIRRTGEFVVNLVTEQTAPAMAMTAAEFGPAVNEMAEAGLTALRSSLVRPPRVGESPVALECRLYRIIDLPTDRLLVLGQILCMHVRDEAVLQREECRIDTQSLGLIARMHGNGWYLRMTDWFQIPTPKR